MRWRRFRRKRNVVRRDDNNDEERNMERESGVEKSDDETLDHWMCSIGSKLIQKKGLIEIRR